MLTLPHKTIVQLLKGQTVIVSKPRLESDILQTLDKPNKRDRKFDHNGKPRPKHTAIYPCLQVYNTTSGRSRFTQWRRYGAGYSTMAKAECMFVITNIEPFGEWWRLSLRLHQPPD